MDDGNVVTEDEQGLTCHDNHVFLRSLVITLFPSFPSQPHLQAELPLLYFPNFSQEVMFSEAATSRLADFQAPFPQPVL